MATVTYDQKQFGVPQSVLASFTSDGSAQAISLGFKPQYVKVWNETDAIIWEWTSNMAATKSFKLVSHDTAQVNVDTNTQISYSAGVLTIGATAVGTSKAIKVLAQA